MDKIPNYIFYRLNLTNYSLNEQEKRNSKVSAFGDKAEALARLDFWSRHKVFSANDARRMKGTEFCCSTYILAQEGIVDQTNSQKINQYYDDYSDAFDSDDVFTSKITGAMDLIEKLADKTTLSFISKAQMYTMFCIAFRITEEGLSYSDELFIKVKLFIEAYNLFRNEYDFSFDDAKMTKYYEAIKKYKLASSEGINKYQNRVIRYEQLYKVCVISNNDIIDTMKRMRAFLSERKGDGSMTFEQVDISAEE